MTSISYQGLRHGTRAPSKVLTILALLLGLCLHPMEGPAGETASENPEEIRRDPQRAAAEEAKKPPGKEPDRAAPARDPMEIPDDFERRLEEVEPPEIRVTGLIEAGRKRAAIAELNLENLEGIVLLEPGMVVSIPKPNRDGSELNRWLTSFTVKAVNAQGVVIVLENGEEVRLPLMEAKD
jgi:hypothetical protein